MSTNNKTYKAPAIGSHEYNVIEAWAFSIIGERPPEEAGYDGHSASDILAFEYRRLKAEMERLQLLAPQTRSTGPK